MRTCPPEAPQALASLLFERDADDRLRVRQNSDTGAFGAAGKLTYGARWHRCDHAAHQPRVLIRSRAAVWSLSGS